VIDVESVHLSFGETTVLDGVDLPVGAGELVGLVGPNGAGKTSLLRTINGLLDPQSGVVRIDGDRVSELGAKEVSRRVASVPQDTHLEFSFTVEQIVEMGRTPHRSRLDWSAAAEAVDAALERTETARFRDRQVDDLSGGERQRVLLARALAQEAPALVLDEPTGSLDVNHQIRVLDLVRDLVDDGRTAIAAIHDLDLAARYCDRLALLYDGAFERVGPPDEVLRSETLESAFDTAAAVTEDAITATPRVTAVGHRPERDTSVHIVGGGRGAARALGECWAAGFDVSAGIVPPGDAVATLAADLDVPVVTAEPYCAISADARELVATHLSGADVVVRATEAPVEAMDRALADVETVVGWSGAADILDTDGPGPPGGPALPPEPNPVREPSVVRAVVRAAADGSRTDD
jgi:iron complex transport system ATP-binding protein